MPFYETKCTNEECELSNKTQTVMCSFSGLEDKLNKGCKVCKKPLQRIFTASGIKTSDNGGRLKT